MSAALPIARPVWGVSALLLATGDALAARFGALAVRGELSGFSRAGSGHCYFSLKDADGNPGVLRCAMFRRAAMLVDFQPADGQQVELRGRLGVYEARGELQFIVEAMQRGDFYASSGVTLKDVRFDPGSKTLKIEIAAEDGVSYTTQFIGTRKGYDRAVEKIPTPEGENVPYRLRYSKDVGAVLATSDSLTPSYTLTGDELYVRAVITSSASPKNPIEPGQKAKAWTQPVGW